MGNNQKDNNSNSGGVSSPLAPDRRGGLFSSHNPPPLSFLDRDEIERNNNEKMVHRRIDTNETLPLAGIKL